MISCCFSLYSSGINEVEKNLFIYLSSGFLPFDRASVRAVVCVCTYLHVCDLDEEQEGEGKMQSA